MMGSANIKDKRAHLISMTTKHTRDTFGKYHLSGFVTDIQTIHKYQYQFPKHLKSKDRVWYLVSSKNIPPVKVKQTHLTRSNLFSINW